MWNWEWRPILDEDYTMLLSNEDEEHADETATSFLPTVIEQNVQIYTKGNGFFKFFLLKVLAEAQMQ